MASGHPAPDAVHATLGRGSAIGRYIVLGLVGRGGMGEVYAAYDPELDRRVAVKLLRVKPGNGVTLVEGRQRTLREAQAIARLSHPNVVVVYDVGTFEDKVFIAMEFVEGNTVTYWLEAQQRSWRDILKVFIAAGHGLAAAHEKGLVHRDFKPDNVMVGRDGQARVMDFGLARQISEKTASPMPAAAPIPIKPPDPPLPGDTNTMVLDGNSAPAIPVEIRESNSGVLDMRLTRPGAMMGTPAYMAPEQFRGTLADARSDQFGFCISLYEALYGERPFAGEGVSKLARAVVRGEVRPVPAGSKVPLWVRKVLLRGLMPKPEDRWSSMEALLDALGKDPSVARRRWIYAGAGLVALAAAAVGVRPILVQQRNFCASGPEKLAGIWEVPKPGAPEPPSHVQIRGAFVQTGKTYALEVFATVSRSLTAYAQRWAGVYKEACEATHVRGDQSSAVLDLRMTCLQERLGGLRALTDVFKNANGEVVGNAVSAANALASLDRCADVPLLRAVVQPPEDQQTRASVEATRKKLADLKAQYDAGRWKQALDDAPSIVATARALGYKPLLAEALLLHGLMMTAKDPPAGEKAMVEAFWAADASRHDELRAEAASRLVFTVGFLQGRSADGDRWATAAKSVLQRIGGHELLHAWLMNDLGCVYHLKGDEQPAVHMMKEALALKEKVLGRNHPDVGRSEINLAMFVEALGQHQDALAHLARALELMESGLGVDHPEVATILSNRGEILTAVGRYKEARQAFDRARIIWETELGPDNLNLGFALTGIGLSYLAEGNPNNALVPLERAYRIRSHEEPEPSRRAETSFALARALWDANRDRRRARTLAEQAREGFEQASTASKRAVVDSWLAARAR